MGTHFHTMNKSSSFDCKAVISLQNEITSFAKQSNIDCIGFGSFESLTDVEKVGPDSFAYATAISLVVELPLDAVKEAKEGPSIALRESYKVANKKMKMAALGIAEKLKEAGYSSRIIDPAQRLDADNLKGPVSLKAVARICGLGWIGNNGLLVTEQFGPRVRTIAILTDMPIIDTPATLNNKCGECRECIDNCALKVIKCQTFEMCPPSRDGTIDWVKCGKFEMRLIGDGNEPEMACGKCIAFCPLSYPS